MELLYSNISGEVSVACVHVESRDGCTVRRTRRMRSGWSGTQQHPHVHAHAVLWDPPSPARTPPLLLKWREISGAFPHAEHPYRCNTWRIVVGFVYIRDLAPSKLRGEITVYYHLPAREPSFHQSTPT